MAKRILVVDDEDVVCSMLTELFTENGYDVSVAQTGEACLHKVESEYFDLIVLDINMPDVSGCGVSAVLGANEKTRDIPIIFLTGYIDQEETKQLRNRLAGHKLISKPFDTQDLLAAVADSLGM
jgi:CheY-like chemotaxis protein